MNRIGIFSMAGTRIFALAAALLFFAGAAQAAVPPPAANDLILALESTTIPEADGVTIANWQTLIPVGGSLPSWDTPTASVRGGVKWVKNDWASYDSFNMTGIISSGVAVNGATIVVAVTPIRSVNDTHNWDWDSIVDCNYDGLVLGVLNWDGRVCVRRKGSLDFADTSTAIPSGKKIVLSLVVQPDGPYKVFANGIEIMNNTDNRVQYAMTSLDHVNVGDQSAIGRNAYDGWPTFNGFIGDVYIYKVALTDDDRQVLEASLIDKFSMNDPFLSVSTTGIAFGKMTPGYSTDPQTVTLTNVGQGSLTFSSVVLGGANAADFVMDPASASLDPLGAGESRTFTVAFAPQAANGTGAKSATITLDALSGLVMIDLSGTAVYGDLSVSTTSIAFGKMKPGLSTDPQTITLTNAGKGSLTFSEIAKGGPNAADFAMVPDPASTAPLGAGESRTFTVAFAPKVASGTGAKAATITLGASSGPVTIDLSGTALYGELEMLRPISTVMELGDPAVGTTGPLSDVRFRNMGAADVTFKSIAVSSGFVTVPADLDAFPPLSGNMISGFQVAAKPTTGDEQTGTLTITYNLSDGNPDQSLSIDLVSSTTNRTVAGSDLQAAFNAVRGTPGAVIEVPAGTYDGKNDWQLNIGGNVEGIRFVATGDGAVLSKPPAVLITGGASEKTTVTFENFVFSQVAPWEWLGNVWINGNATKNVTFRRCTFSLTNTGREPNGDVQPWVGLHVENGPQTIDLVVESCIFTGPDTNDRDKFGIELYNTDGYMAVRSCEFGFEREQIRFADHTDPKKTILEVSDCTFVAPFNIALNGWNNTSNPEIDIARCTFIGAVSRGILFDNGGSVEIDRCWFGSPPGCNAIRMQFASSLIVRNSVIEGGQRGIRIQGVPLVNRVENCTFIGTVASTDSRAIYSSDAATTVINSIVLGYDALYQGQAWDVGTTNIAYNQADPVLVDPMLAFQGGAPFARPATISAIDSPNDYSLSPGSPAIDAGTCAGAPDHDYNGDPRPRGAGCDIGAYEASGAVVTGNFFKRADMNDDGLLNISDPIYLLNFLFMDGPAPTCYDAGHINEDEIVNMADAIYDLTFQFISGPRPPYLNYPNCEKFPGCTVKGNACP